MKIEDDTMLETMKKNLNKNPMFRFSLGSKELFHSNFLAWLLGESSICKTVLNILGYEDVKDVNPEKVYTFRELQNIDLLVVIVKDNETDVIMLENKFKSYPYKEQLEKYSSKEETLKEKIVMKLKEEDEKLKKEKISIKKRILLSIQTPYFFNKEKFKSKAEKEWDLLTYKSYIDKLGNIQKNDFETCFEYLSKYIEFTNEIISKLNCQLEDGKGSIEILKNSKNVKKVLNVLSKVKLNDLFQKNIGAKLLDSIQENILADGKDIERQDELSFLNELQTSQRAQVVLIRLQENEGMRYGVRFSSGAIEFLWNTMIVKSKEETNGNYETCFQNGKPIFDSFINKLNPLDSECNTKKTAEWAYYKTKSNKQMRYNKFYKENKYKEIYFRRKLEMNSVESFDSLAKIIIDEFKKIDNHFQDQMKNGIEAWYAKNSKQI